MVKSLVEPKRTIIESIRQKILRLHFVEEVEFDPIEIEPVIIYSKFGKRRIFLKHKWDTIALVLLASKEKGDEIAKKLGVNQDKLEANEEDGTSWLKFQLPAEENLALETLSLVSSD